MDTPWFVYLFVGSAVAFLVGLLLISRDLDRRRKANVESRNRRLFEARVRSSGARDFESRDTTEAAPTLVPPHPFEQDWDLYEVPTYLRRRG